MKTIPVHPGKQAIVDDDDFDRLKIHRWFLLKDGKRCYAKRNVKIGDKWTTVSMHSDVLGLPRGRRIDHRDRDGLNNQKDNLRPATQSQNCMNRVSPGNKFGFKGVSFDGRTSRPFFARLRTKGKTFQCGYFATAIEAAMAYNHKAVEVFGEFANLNPV